MSSDSETVKDLQAYMAAWLDAEKLKGTDNKELTMKASMRVLSFGALSLITYSEKLEELPEGAKIAALVYYKEKILETLDRAMNDAIANHIHHDTGEANDKAEAEVDRILAKLTKH